jgi:hypothetical protein
MLLNIRYYYIYIQYIEIAELLDNSIRFKNVIYSIFDEFIM